MTGRKSGARVADVVAQTLYAHGVRHAFGVPGGEVVTLIDALERAGVRFNLARHETSAALMAAGASAMSGNPEILVTTVGPGLTNAVNGVADAFQERVPLLVFSGVVDRATRARYTHQVIDHAHILRPLVKASFEIEIESAASTIARALAIAMSEPRGPVHLDLSPAVAAAEAPYDKFISSPLLYQVAASPTGNAVQFLSKKLLEAERPLIIAGFEAVRAQAGKALLALAESTDAAVITTYKAKGIIPEQHPLALGAAGLSPLADEMLLDLIRRSDLLLLVGYDPIEMRLGWIDFKGYASDVIDVSGFSPDHAMHHANARIIADPRTLLEAMEPALLERRRWVDGEPGNARLQLQKIFTRDEPWGPHAIIEALNEVVGPDGLATVDSGAHRILLSQKWKTSQPLSLLQSAGFCTMNAALPLAIGAQVADPNRRVFAVVGDGGMEMGIGELATARDLELALTVIVFQDRSLALIAMKQAAAHLSPLGVALGETDFAGIARGFGGYGANVENIDDFNAELEAAGSRPGFTVIACRFHADAYIGAF